MILIAFIGFVLIFPAINVPGKFDYSLHNTFQFACTQLVELWKCDPIAVHNVTIISRLDAQAPVNFTLADLCNQKFGNQKFGKRLAWQTPSNFTEDEIACAAACGCPVRVA